MLLIVYPLHLPAATRQALKTSEIRKQVTLFGHQRSKQNFSTVYGCTVQAVLLRMASERESDLKPHLTPQIHIPIIHAGYNRLLDDSHTHLTNPRLQVSTPRRMVSKKTKVQSNMITCMDWLDVLSTDSTYSGCRTESTWQCTATKAPRSYEYPTFSCSTVEGAGAVLPAIS